GSAFSFHVRNRSGPSTLPLFFHRRKSVRRAAWRFESKRKHQSSSGSKGNYYMSERIGIVGVGRMGANMARRLKDCGFKVTAVYDARLKVAKELAQELECEPCRTLPKLTELADII